MLELWGSPLDARLLVYIYGGSLVILLALLLRQGTRLSRLEKKFTRFAGKGPQGSLDDVLGSLHQEVGLLARRMGMGEKDREALHEKSRTSLRRLGLVRYNAFQDTGSDLSFSLALLDENKDGVILTTLYGREESRTYAKPIKDGRSSYKLSAEEEEALGEAQKSSPPRRREGGP